MSSGRPALRLPAAATAAAALLRLAGAALRLLAAGLALLVAALLMSGLLADTALAAEATAPLRPESQALSPSSAQLQALVQRLAQQDGGSAAARLEVQVGSLDPRLKLAACNAIEPYLPAGSRLWGSTRVGLRCTDGPVRWNVYLPVTVKVWGQALVAQRALPAGTELAGDEFTLAEVDLAATPSAPIDRRADLIGRRLAVALPAGSAVRAEMLRARVWFNAGEPVQVVSVGEGFSVSWSGEALGAGIAGQSVRVRTESGRIVTGLPVGVRRVELKL